MIYQSTKRFRTLEEMLSHIVSTCIKINMQTSLDVYLLAWPFSLFWLFFPSVECIVALSSSGWVAAAAGSVSSEVTLKFPLFSPFTLLCYAMLCFAWVLLLHQKVVFELLCPLLDCVHFYLSEPRENE